MVQSVLTWTDGISLSWVHWLFVRVLITSFSCKYTSSDAAECVHISEDPLFHSEYFYCLILSDCFSGGHSNLYIFIDSKSINDKHPEYNIIYIFWTNSFIKLNPLLYAEIKATVIFHATVLNKYLVFPHLTTSILFIAVSLFSLAGVETHFGEIREMCHSLFFP